ncbi:MAG: hypothetical protein ACLP50_27345 [Solirubrobacteraceae bacterium]
MADQGIFLTRHCVGIDGLAIEYLAADEQRAERVLEDRFGEFATLRYRGGSNHTFRPFPLPAGWLTRTSCTSSTGFRTTANGPGPVRP